MYDPLTNPPMPDWNNLPEDMRCSLSKEWEFCSCPHDCGDMLGFYNAIRAVLKEREKRILAATMAG